MSTEIERTVKPEEDYLRLINRDLSKSNRVREGDEGNLTEAAREVIQMAKNAPSERDFALNIEAIDIMSSLMKVQDSVAHIVIHNLFQKRPRQLNGNSGLNIKTSRWDTVGPEFLEDVLELAHEEASLTRESYIGTHHILLGLVRKDNDQLQNFFSDFGVNLIDARTECIRIVSNILPHRVQRP